MTESLRAVSLGQQVKTLSANSDVSMLAALVDRELIKVLRVNHGGDGEGDALKVVRGFRPWAEKPRLNLNHAAWNPHPSHDHVIAAGNMDGRLMFWSLHGSTRQASPSFVRAHTRSISRIAWHRGAGNILLSCAHGSVKLWDIRSTKHPAVHIQEQPHLSPRDATFSSLTPHLFAVAFSDGSVLVYDEREPSAPLHTKRAHGTGLIGAFSIAWHPYEPGVLASSGRDSVIEVWQMEEDKLLASVNTVQSASRIAWRPQQEVPTQLAANLVAGSANMPTEFETRVFVWDTRHPNLPARTLPGDHSFVTDLLWSSNAKSLFASTRDGFVTCMPYSSGDRPHKGLPNTAMAMHWRDVAHCHEEVSSDVGLDPTGDLPVPGGTDTFSQAEPSPPFGNVAMFRSDILSPDRQKFSALAAGSNVSLENRKNACKQNAALAHTIDDEEAEAVWRLLLSLESEASLPVISRVKEKFIKDSIRAFCESGKVQLSSTMACLYVDLVKPSIKNTPYVMRSAYIYRDMLSRLEMDTKARELTMTLHLKN
mmetsp:Transcript_11175/g.34234  ORF Transcript_11175/g.34234 Transcript_11175/m.34234 type:complete len:537 (+) Transcript_11175:142-1752(+)